MCGICGIVQVEGAPRPVASTAMLEHVTDTMMHRGPSDRGTYLDEGIALGVRRLSIVDVEGGHQPVSSEDESVWAIQNGELYNHRAVRETLDGHRFASRCDSEVIPHLYERDGDGYPKALRGMFAIAVWDARRRRLVLARDRLGIKPLYYARSGDLLCFASELKTLLATGLVSPSLDYAALDAYLTLGYFPAPLTPLAGVRKVLPGHILVVDGSVREEPFWSFPPPAPERMTEEDGAERLLAKLEESVRLRLMSDVPLGAMLSGGLDSSLVAALMARNMSTPVKTFAVGFAEDARSELADAHRVAAGLGADHTELELSFAEDALSLEETVWHQDEPLADLSTVGFDLLCGVAARDVTVALSGQGADELLGGYRKHVAARGVDALAVLPRPARRLAGRIARRGSDTVRRAGATLGADGPVERLLAMSADMDGGRRAALLRGALAAADGAPARDAVASRLDGARGDVLSTTLFLDAQLALPDLMLHYFDRASMAHSLEVRVPFLDHELVELCATIPSSLKVRGRTTKAVLRRAARGLVPDDIIDKPKVGFFALAADGWLRARLASAVDEGRLGDRLVEAGLVDEAALRGLVSSFLERRTDAPRARLVLALLMLETWLATFLPRALERPAALR